MRPLTADEVNRIRETSVRRWRPVWRLQVFRALLYGFILVAAFPAKVDWFLLAWLFLAWIFVTGPMVVWRGYRDWNRQLEADLAEGKAEQKTAKVYDRFRRLVLFTPKKYVIWADGVEFEADRPQFDSVVPGDTVLVDYLPRTQLIIDLRKVAQA